MRVEWLRAALRNLDDIANYIAQDNPVAAERMVARVRIAVERLREHPESGRPGRVAGTRELVVPGTPLVVPYRVLVDRVQVLRVFHAARRWPRRF